MKKIITDFFGYKKPIQNHNYYFSNTDEYLKINH